MSLIPELVSRSTTYIATSLAQQPNPGDQGGQGEDFGKSSPLGLLVLILFLIAVGFLVRSMTKHLKRVPASFDEPRVVSDGEAPGNTVEIGDPEVTNDSQDDLDMQVNESNKLTESTPKSGEPAELGKTAGSDSSRA